MIGIDMKLDVHPSCPAHYFKMMLTDWILEIDRRRELKTCYQCPEPSCDYHYHIWQGYFRARVGERMRLDPNFAKQCPRHGNLMFISESTPRVWCCGVEGCDYSETEAEAATIEL